MAERFGHWDWKMVCRFWQGLCLCLFILGCEDTTYDVDLQVQDASGNALVGTTIRVDGRAFSTDNQGFLRVQDLKSPHFAIVSAPGFISEIVPLGFHLNGARIPIRLMDDAGGKRLVIHGGGDAMLGRRYEESMPESRRLEGSAPLISSEGDSGAEGVVSEVADAFSAADLRLLNLETVVGNFPDEAAYPKKRWILQTPPAALSALRALGVDVAILANNHLRDYGDDGVASTLNALRDHSLVGLGAGLDEIQAKKPLELLRQGHRVGLLAYTTIDGAFVNDNYPRSEDLPPADLDEAEAWKYEKRPFEYQSDALIIEEGLRTLGDIWQELEPHLESLPAEDAAALWAAAEGTYPELQDWVARWGHGGANFWRGRDSVAEIQALDAQNDIVVVNFHSGYQFSSAPSTGLRQMAREAIDGGADLILSHHPHVIQGIEYYKGKPIIYSLGNFLFDQAFLSTFDSYFMRAIYEGGSLIQLKLYPLQLNAYKPAPLVGEGALNLMARLWESTLRNWASTRGSDLAVYNLPVVPDADTLPIEIHEEWGTFRVEAAPTLEPRIIDLAEPTLPLWGEEDGWLTVPKGALIEPAALPEGAQVGEDIFGWGHFEPWAGAEPEEAGTHFTLGGTYNHLIYGHQAQDLRAMRLARSAQNDGPISVRPAVRFQFQAHEYYTREGNAFIPLDSPARYAVSLASKMRGESGLAKLRFEFHHFNDLDPTTAPSTTPLAVHEIEVDASSRWALLRYELPDELFDPSQYEGLAPNGVVVYFQLDVPRWRDTRWSIDDFEFIAWRAADSMGAGPVRAHYLRNVGTLRGASAFVVDQDDNASE